MKDTSVVSVLVTVLACGGLLVLSQVEPRGSTVDPSVHVARRAVRAMYSRELNRERAEEEVAGYYEGLLTGRPQNLMGRAHDSAGYRFRGDFLYYESRPGIDVPDYYEPGLRLITNSHGLPDQEYEEARSPGTWRVAILGDSVTRGQGAPFGHSFEARLEDKLNTQHTDEDISRYELINFSNTGYRLTQLMDVALEKAPRFAPDVYVLALSRLAVSRKWGDHLVQLVYDGVDLKYEYLRDLAKKAELDPRDPPGLMHAKLARHRLETLRWVLGRVEERAVRDGARLVVVFVPTANPPHALEPLFEDVADVVHDLGIPLIDVLDTFADVDDMSAYQVAAGNVHPNSDGHQRITERLYDILSTDRAAAEALLGRALGSRRTPSTLDTSRAR